MKRRFGLIFLLAGAGLAQPPQTPQPAQPPVQIPMRIDDRNQGEAPPPPPAARPPMERSLIPGPSGRWWNNPQAVQRLSLSSDQQKKMDDIFQQNRLRLIDLNAALQKEEVILEPMVAADQPDEPKVLAQIDRVVQARAELEKANARFLLGIRRVLTLDQWKKLRGEEPLPADAAQPPRIRR